MEVAEESQFDIVGGLVVNKGDKKGADWNSYDKINIQYSAEGNCYERDKHQILTNLPGFEGKYEVNTSFYYKLRFRELHRKRHCEKLLYRENFYRRVDSNGSQFLPTRPQRIFP